MGTFQLDNNISSFLSDNGLLRDSSDPAEPVREFITSELKFFFSDLVNFGFSVPALRALFEAIGGDDVATDIDPLTPEPVIDVANGIAETASVELPVGLYVLEIGSPFGVGDEGGLSVISDFIGLEVSELSGILRNDIDADLDDNDAEQILAEILNGNSGANFDFETEPGIDGVELIGLTPDSYTISIQDGNVNDILTLGGPGVEEILNGFDAEANVSDNVNAISIVDVSSETIIVGPDNSNPILDVVGDSFAGIEDVQQLFDAALQDTVDNVGIISVDASSFSVRIDNELTGAFDLLVLFDSTGNIFDGLSV